MIKDQINKGCRMKTICRLLIITLVILGILLSAGYYYSANILTKLAKSQLQTAGFQEINLSAMRPGITGITIPELKFEKATAGQIIKVNFQNLTVGYSLTTLLNKKINSIDIESGDVNVAFQEQASSQDSPTQQSRLLLPESDQLPFEQISIKNLALNLTTAEQLNYRASASVQIIKNQELVTGTIDLTTVENFDFVNFVKVRFTMKGQELNSAIELETPTISNLPDLPPSHWKLNLRQLTDQLNLSGEGLLQMANPLPLKLKGNYQFNKESGSLQLKTDAGSENNLLTAINQILQKRTLPVSLSSGEISAELKINLEKFNIQEANLLLQMKGVDGILSSAVISGLTANHELKILGGLKSQKPSPLKIKKISFGPEITNIQSVISLSTDKNGKLNIKLTDTTGDIFNGQISCQSATYNPFASQNKLTAQLKGLDISKVLELYPQKNISATGIIDGTIPLSITKQSLTLEKSTLQARAPGIIRYNSAETLGNSENSQMKFVADVLKNFHYSHLSAGLNLDHTGDLLIALKLQGKNPEMNFNQEVNVNLNIEENLPALLRSLRAISGIDSKIKKALEK